MNFKVLCSEDFIKMLNMYKEHEIEVGGMIFGRKILKKYNINSLTFKKGEAFKIDFFFDDKKIYQAPINQKLIGTWHLHPMQNDAAPSYTDIEQWHKWKKSYIHVICSKKDFKIYNCKGECLYEQKF